MREINARELGDSIEMKIKYLCPVPDEEEFIKKRNQEFAEFRTLSYEEEIKSGKLRDASDWCTEIRLRTEMADSLLANFNNVNRYDYDFVELYWWYTKRYFDYYCINQNYYAEIYQSVVENKETFEALAEIRERDTSEISALELSHSYSFRTRGGDKHKKTDRAIMDTKGAILFVENINFD